VDRINELLDGRLLLGKFEYPVGERKIKKPFRNSPKPHVAKKIGAERLLRVHLEIYEYARCK
jgi:hypothetical protein